MLDLRIYRIKPGKCEEFDSLVREETVPLARSFGQQVVTFGRSLEDDDVYFLVRAFASAAERRSGLDEFYGSTEWEARYDNRVGEMLVSYEIAVLTVPTGTVDRWIESGPGAIRSN